MRKSGVCTEFSPCEYRKYEAVLKLFLMMSDLERI